ncbi:hypothetical protein C8J56DRAFT_1065738 [Mycena floridula]|nr:hypothetical protein C8J56DRAFT_1065738 [Mycena floridula]
MVVHGRFQPSPHRARNSKKKTQTRVILPQQLARRQLLQERLRALSTGATEETGETWDSTVDVDMEDGDGPQTGEAHEDDGYETEPETRPSNPTRSQRTPDEVTEANRLRRRATRVNLYASWQRLLPLLSQPLKEYRSLLHGTQYQTSTEIHRKCEGLCQPQKTEVIGLFAHHFSSITVTFCQCDTLPQVLVRHGLFPTAPLRPITAVSISLLHLYRCLFEQSCDAVHAVALGLKNHYERNGFRLLNKDKETFDEPFRKGFGYAVQWLDALEILIDKEVDAALGECLRKIDQLSGSPTISSAPLPSTLSPSEIRPCLSIDPAAPAPRYPETSEDEDPVPEAANEEPEQFEDIYLDDTTPDECHRILQEICPCCFAGNRFGRTFQEGGDVHVAVDGNFHHKHSEKSGEGVKFHGPRHFIPKKFVDAVGDRADKARAEGKAQPREYRHKVPDEAIRACRDAHHAAKGDHEDGKPTPFDDTGLMALVCRHDIPLFFANIDTPGEQQKYSLALVEYLFNMLPRTATVVVCYDIACVLDCSTCKYALLPDWICERLQLVTLALHAYAHQWSCQLVYNPRMREGLGFTDGEGVERLWSRIRKLISIERRSGRHRRIWLIDRQATFVGHVHRDDLGGWLTKRSKVIDDRLREAEKIIRRLPYSKAQLRQQWQAQKTAQLSIRAHAPARLKQELDKVLQLQSDAEALDASIRDVKKALRAASSPASSLRLLADLQKSQDSIKSQAEALYASLNITENFPTLTGANLKFVQHMYLARDLKINIRNHAVESFEEWARLDSVVHGHEPVGTTKYQMTRRAITRRKPAIMNGLRKYNKYVAIMKEEAENLPDLRMVIPQPLPLHLEKLRDVSDLMEDVWVTPSEGDPPPWLIDPRVRKGIRAMLTVQACIHERRRIGRESDNLCRWFGKQLAAIELAMRDPRYLSLRLILESRRQHLLYRKSRWTNCMASAVRFDNHVQRAVQIADALSRSAPGAYTWIAHTIPSFEANGEPDVESDAEEEILESVWNDNVDHILADHVAVEAAAYSDDDDQGEQPQSIENDLTDVEALDELPDIASVWTISPSLSFSFSAAWTISETLSSDQTLISTLKRLEPVLEPDAPVARRLPQVKAISLTTSDLDILRTPDAWLNSGCIDTLGAWIQILLAKSSQTAQHCAIFSTLVFPKAAAGRDLLLWTLIRDSEYWSKDIWIIPIHRPSEHHWVLAVAIRSQMKLYLYDSFAGDLASWSDDISKLLKLFHRLQTLAKSQGQMLHFPSNHWSVSPNILIPVQQNGYDCGIWVLAWISAVLRGFWTSDLVESRLPQLRSLLYNACLYIPAVTAAN